MIRNYKQYKYTSIYSEIPDEIKCSLRDSANVYYSESYYRFITEFEGEIIYFFSNEMILVGYIKKKYLFRWINLPSEPFQPMGAEKSNVKDFLDSFVELCRYIHIDWIGPTGATALFSEAPSDSISIPFGSHVIDLQEEVDYLWQKVHSKHRNVIRNSEKKGVRIVQGGKELIKDYVSLDVETWKRSGKQSVIEGYLTELVDAMPDEVKIYMAYYENVPQSGAVFLQNSQMSYYLFGASANSPLTGANNLLHWVAINDAKKNGIKKYSFVGCRINEDEDSKYHGIQRFKARFGGELKEGKMFKVIISSPKYNLYRQMVKLKTKKEYKDIIDQELHKWI